MEPQRGIILYDSVCILCSRWSRFVVTRDSQAIFRFAPMQSDKGRAMAISLGIDPDDPDSFAVIFNGATFKKSAAVIAIVEQLPRWQWCRYFRYLPEAMLDWLYDRIAKNRYRIFGKSQMCIIPEASIKARFDDLDSAITRVSAGER